MFQKQKVVLLLDLLATPASLIFLLDDLRLNPLLTIGVLKLILRP